MIPTNGELFISNEKEAAPADIELIQHGLRDFNNYFIRDDGFEPYTLFLRKPDGSIVGGLLGEFYWGWLHISILWIHEDYRELGYGSRLLEAAEEQAHMKDCIAIHLDTMSFQAQPFYERHGYSVYGRLDDLPIGHQRIFLVKYLGEYSNFDQKINSNHRKLKE